LADARLQVASEFLEDAQLCLGNGRFRSAVSRAYYGAFHACIALFEHYGYRPSNFVGWGGRPAKRWEHGVVFKHFPLEFVHKRKLVDWRIGIIPRRSYKLRIKADYKVDLVITQALAKDACKEAKRLVQTVEQEVG
jgi:uncharacterized protein (UPF0332 family)